METSFENRLHAHQDALFRAALKMTHGDLARAEDMVQDTYVKALRHADRFQEGTNLRAWLMRILYNNVISMYRHRQVAKEGPMPENFDPASKASTTSRSATRSSPPSASSPRTTGRSS
jgi:RNA polymerase sigma-70 factor (ECF subfamily)